MRRFVQTGAFAVACFAALGASEGREVLTVPACTAESTLPLVEPQTCDERELAAYMDTLSEQFVSGSEDALVRVGFDEAARVSVVCVDEHTGRDAWRARRRIAEKLVEWKRIPAGPSCVAGRRIDFNRYEAKLAEAKRAQNWCGLVQGGRMKALGKCEKFASDWILYNRIGVTRPYLYVKPENGTAVAAETLSRCARTTRGFEAQSQCIEADGFELIEPPKR
jgi:hypothetical protein